MKADDAVKRLFVGGLGRDVTSADLRDRFSRFGDVSEVEMITRRDDQGNPQKVFAYINIRVAEENLNKCMSILNKTKWKGGTLQIQLAKESFLHRLAQEREEAKAKKEKSTIGNTSFLEKMKVVDFHMKAVPGTEVPGHKNWVVSKFGRVLPVLHLKNQHKRKIMKYDPSKYCHNLKKIAEDVTHATPVSSLTWELEGGDNPMNKKQRGEFCAVHSPPQKRVKVQNEAPAAFPAVRARPHTVRRSPHPTQQEAAQEVPCKPITTQSPHPPASHCQKFKNVFVQTSGMGAARSRDHMSDDDTDSEEEIRLVIAREESLGKTTWSSVGDSADEPFEVVRGDFKSGVQKLPSVTALGISGVSCQDGEGNVVGNEINYDSGDTDEIVTAKKKAGKIKNTEFSQMERSACKKTFLKNRRNCELSDHCVKAQKRKTNPEQAVGVRVTPHCSSREDAGSESEFSESSGDEEYDAMMKNCLRVQLTLADLEQLACGDLQSPEDPESSGQETTAKADRTPGGLHRARPCIRPEEIVAALLEGEENTCEKQKSKENNLKPKFQAFKGVGCLYGKESVRKPLKENVASDNVNTDQNSLKLGPSSMSVEKGCPPAYGSSSKITPLQHARKTNDPNQTQPRKRQSAFKSQDHKMVSPSSLEVERRNPISSLLPLKDERSLSIGTKIPTVGFDEDCCHRTREAGEGSGQSGQPVTGKAPGDSSKRDAQESNASFPLGVNSWSSVDAKEKHAEDNQKRLAALDARQKAKEVRKKLVHNALADLDGHPENKPTHIIFDSDSDTEEQSHLGEEPMEESMSRAAGRLFDSSEDEQSGSEDDSHRFQIKPQFEGRAGQKLMDLQSHFGTDHRFRMDSRFLESDSEEEQEEVNEKKTAEEEELAAEKLKALNVVQSVLHTTLSNSMHKGSVAAKKFRDVVRYDPTRHDHSTYERKSNDKPKESKAKRRKQREEAEKLPEVSKEMYYSIAADLKEIFQATKVSSETTDNAPSNETRDGEKVEVHNPTTLTTGAEQPSSFTFSFFDSDVKDVKEACSGPCCPFEDQGQLQTLEWSCCDIDGNSCSREPDPGHLQIYVHGESDQMSVCGYSPVPFYCHDNTDTYRAEAVKTGKVVWQGASRFQDSSSGEEDVAEETEGRKSREVSLPEKESTRFFFFSKNDERLGGSDLFWRGVGSNISRNSWETRTNNLRMDCRKKHKDAKRRVKPK